ncbi:MAG: uncharacterized ferritin-like protein (DUF455 family) [Alphaproteobacteria bacterium]|jgi:uncharacterized ferritin-like protein (DUF455 family)
MLFKIEHDMTLFEAILKALHTKDATQKASLVLNAYTQFHAGNLLLEGVVTPPDYPARPDKPELLPATQMPKRSKGFKKKNALLHAIAHIELNAIDLACDMVTRYSSDDLPQEFYIDWLSVANDEARHFNLLNTYLLNNQSFYGAYPAHNSLWDTAFETRHNLGARLAVVPMVLEARGLDVTPRMISEFQTQNDTQIVDILSHIYKDEINHVYVGVKWFEYVTQQPIEKATDLFHSYLKKYFRGRLIPPFNIPARDAALMPRDFYQEYSYV